MWFQMWLNMPNIFRLDSDDLLQKKIHLVVHKVISNINLGLNDKCIKANNCQHCKLWLLLKRNKSGMYIYTIIVEAGCSSER